MCFFYNFIRFFETYVLFLHVERDGMATSGAEVGSNYLYNNAQTNEIDMSN